MKIKKKSKISLVILCSLFLCLFMGTKTFADTSTLDKRIYSWANDLTSFGPRITGTVAWMQAGKYVQKELKEFGIPQVWVLETPGVYLQNNYQWGVSIAGKTIPSFPVHSSFRPSSGFGSFTTGVRGLTAQVLDVGDAFDASGNLTFNPADVSGKIVLFNFHLPPVQFATLFYFSKFIYDPDQTIDPNGYLHQPYESNFAAVQEYVLSLGAVGFVGVLSDYFNSNNYFNEDYPSEDYASLTIPGLWVKASDGQAIRKMLKSTSRMTINLNGSYNPVTARTVIGFLPGISSDTIMISSHYDSVWDGGVEDASGTSSVLALAQHYASLPVSKRPKSLMFVLNDTHWTGYQAHENFVENYIDNTWNGHQIIANVSIEHIAKEVVIQNDGSLAFTGKNEPLAIFNDVGQNAELAIQQAISDNDLDRTFVLPTTTPFRVPTDAWVVAESGLPVITMISAPIYLYDKIDTIKMVDEDELGMVASTFIQIVDDISLMSAAEIKGN